MECESCGRYRPSAEIVATVDTAGRLVMACARCRRVLMRPASRAVAPMRPAVTRPG